jgi:glycosyltransferase involved in cell wall biosynthesis
MSNATIYLHPNAYDTSEKRLLGRHSAGESFLRGFLRHAEVEAFSFWNAAGAAQDKLDALLQRIHPPTRPVRWIAQRDRGQLGATGVLSMPTPRINQEAWRRLAYGGGHYAICGITHTTATANVMNILPDLLVAPLEGHDALICTSTAVRASVETQLSMMRDYMQAEYGARRRPELQRVTIPLGVNAADFATTPEQRQAWRERLDIPDDTIVALYVGRFNVRGKMNPALMAMALERAAQHTTAKLCWVNSGWAENEAEGRVYHEESRKLCPSVEYREVDGRQPDVRFSIWSVADFFLSFSDNIQETFGLTPVEAMAAGLPSVVSDWDGYKDTVRHGVDGFRVPTLAPPAGFGGDLAYWFSNEWLTYDTYIGATGQFTAVDLAEAEAAICTLVADRDLRLTMGAAAQTQARTVFDWSVIIPQYQALWADQDARRRAGTPRATPRENPLRPDPYSLFAAYATRGLSDDAVVALNPRMTLPLAKTRLEAPLAAYSRFNRPTDQEVEAVMAHLAEHGPTAVARLGELVASARRNLLKRGLIWLARHDVVAIAPPP